MCGPVHKNLTNPYSRRELLAAAGQSSLLVAAGSIVSGVPFIGQSSALGETRDHHFYLHIQIESGLDVQYLFDSRPLDMTTKKLIANYHTEERIPYIGTNGQATLRTVLTNPLMKWSDRFSVINGVVMSASFDGHEQAENMLLTGNPFGGESFIPWMNTKGRPLDYVQTAPLNLSALTNKSGGIELDAVRCQGLAQSMGALQSQGDLLKSRQAQSERLGRGGTSFAASARSMAKALGGVTDLSALFGSVQIPSLETPDPNNLLDILAKTTRNNLHMITELMRSGITNTGVLAINFLPLDTHDGTSAQSLPETVGVICEALAGVFQHLSDTPSPSGRSMLDDTTILIGSEFARTMRQPWGDFEKSGTDHNPLTNTLLVAGRGIKGGQVIGQSDFQTAEEELSGAHLTLDANKIKVMGMPFDHAAGRVITEVKPGAYDPALFITPMHVTNTLQELMGVPANRRLMFGRNLPAIPVIQSLLA